MKRYSFLTILLLSLFFIGSCKTQSGNMGERTSKKSSKKSKEDLMVIVYYNPEIGDQYLLMAIENMKGTITHRYNNFNAMAVSFKDREFNELRTLLTLVNGVLDVLPNEKHELHLN